MYVSLTAVDVEALAVWIVIFVEQLPAHRPIEGKQGRLVINR